MSLAAAKAMEDLADCLGEEAEEMPAGMAYSTIMALERAHRRAAERIRERAQRENGPLAVPPEFRGEQAGTRR